MNQDAFNELMKQAQKVQDKMRHVEEELKQMRVTGESGAGMVRITLNGKHDALDVIIDPSLQQEHLTVLQDLVKAAVNDAVRKVEELNRRKASDLASGLDMPPGFNF